MPEEQGTVCFWASCGAAASKIKPKQPNLSPYVLIKPFSCSVSLKNELSTYSEFQSH